MSNKRGQISVEYLIVVGFIVFIIVNLIGVAFYYVGGIKDKIKDNQIEGFAQNLISGANTVFSAGEPSRVTVTAYLPSGVEDIQISGKEIIIRVSSNSGLNVRSFVSNVNLEGALTRTEGVKRIQIIALSDRVVFSEG